VDGFGDHLQYDAGQPLASGHLSFHVRGIEADGMPASNEAKFHLLEVFDHAGHGEACYFSGIRTWGQAHMDWYQHLKFFYCTLEPAPEECGAEVFTGTPAVTWDPGHWYHFEIEFADGLAVMRVSDAELLSIDYADCPIALQQFYLPLQPWVEGAIDCIDGSIYSHVSLVACAEPCDDTNPCTSEDRCQDHTCRGDPVEDGTECDDGDPATVDDQCVGGECVGASGDDDDDGDDDDAGEPQDDDDTSPADSGDGDPEDAGCACTGDREWNGSVYAIAVGMLVMRRRRRP